MFSKFLMVLVALALGGCRNESARHKAAGNVFFKQGKLEVAAEEYRTALRTSPDDANAHTLLGNVRFEQQRYAEAEQEYRASLHDDPHARAAILGLVSLDLRANKLPEARTLLEQLVKDEPRDPEAQIALGKLLYADGKLNEAEAHLRDGLVYAQNEVSALYTLGLVLAKKKDREQANAIFDRLESITEGKAYAPYGRAVAEAASGRNDEALKWLDVALQRGLDDPAQVERDDAFGRLRSNPRFQELIAKAKPRAPPK